MAEPARLPVMYSNMATDFLERGINVPSVTTMLEWFDEAGVNGHSAPHPKMYSSFNPPLPPHAVRLLVIPVHANPSLTEAGTQITKDIESLLPPHVALFKNLPHNYHITIFHTSNPWDPRPNPQVESGSTDLSLPPHERKGSSAKELQAEVEAMHGVVSTSPQPSLVLERIVLATSGTLLMLWTDPAGTVQSMRSTLRSTFPGACTKQPNIVHTSLARLATACQLEEGVRQNVQSACDAWTEKLRGKVLASPDAWFVFETEFSTIEGEKHVMPFNQSTAIQAGSM